jgi:predicted alpha-1,2-mannosidase|tara:strand:+ start:4124 stop:6334 length:2211 start_codon:yes stop_codon:yes gene_type:complete
MEGDRNITLSSAMLNEHPGRGNSRWVDPFLGNAETRLPEPEGVAAAWWRAKPPVGNTHPGAVLPFGMVSACAYSGAYVTGYGRYGVSLTGDSPPVAFERHEALGIAHFQQSGTGRIRVYYNYLLTTPLTGEGLEGLGTRFALAEERAWPGYYSARLVESNVACEVTCTQRGAIHRYEFPQEVTGKVAIDLTAGGLLLDGMRSFPQGGRVEIVEPSVAEGHVWMEGIPIYFRIEVPRASRTGLWEEGMVLPGETLREFPRTYTGEEVNPFGVWFEAGAAGEPLEVRIGFSLRNPERCRDALAQAEEMSFSAVADKAIQRWDVVLGKIAVEGGTAELREIFYSAFYHATLKPADFRNENPFSSRDGPFFFDLATLWDQYKTQLPLLMTLWPEWGGHFVEFLSEVANREGAFPVSYLMDNAPERFNKQATGLCHMILADAQMRGVEADWERILRLLWVTSLSSKVSKGRFAEFARHQVVQPLSHTLDLACAHFAIAQMAKHLGYQRIYDQSLPLLRAWPNAFDENTGLLREDSDYYEGENWNYSFRFLHDMVGRIKLAGGEEAFLDLLDRFFGFREARPGETVHHFEGLNNEPDMEAPYLYHYVGRPDRTAEVVRNVIRYQFATGRGGLPGNDDSGGLSSWLVWSMMGLFPVTGMPVMLICSPVFPRVALKLPGGEFVVRTRNHHADHYYVQRAWLNGRELDRSYLKLSEFQAESELLLEMGKEPSPWGSGSRPPSFVS